MRRTQRLVVDPEEVTRILAQCTVLFLSFHDEPAPYVVPLFFGYEPGRLYVHCAATGTKLDLLHADPRVGFSAVASAEIIESEAACDFTARAQSVIGSGIARIVEAEDERKHGLNLIMRHYTTDGGQDVLNYRPITLSRTVLIAVEIQSMTGKRIHVGAP
jgi:hypothetical protein